MPLSKSSVLGFLLFTVGPVETILIELDDHLRDLDVCLLGGNKICLIAALPLDQKEEFTWLIGCADDFLSSETSGKSLWFLLSFSGFSNGIGSRRIFCVGFPLGSLGFLFSFGLQDCLKLLYFCLSPFQVIVWLPGVVIRIIEATPLDKVL